MVRAGRASQVELVVVALLVAACSSAAPATPGPEGYDVARAREQAATFVTYGIPNDWANYGEQFTKFCMAKFGFDCNRTERSQADTASASEIVQRFVAEKNNPVAILADFTILYAGPSEKAGYPGTWLPPNAAVLPDGYKGRNGGWQATYVGTPAMVVNVDFLTSRNLPIPGSWADLVNPAYKLMIGMSKPGSSGVATSIFACMNLAAGGTLEDYRRGVAFARQLLPNLTTQASIDTFEKGEVPVSLQLDLTANALVQKEKARGVNARVVIPSDGSIYLPSVLVMNGYDTAYADVGKMFMEWVLTDEGQTIFAKFGARPIRSIVGTDKLVVPDSAKALWLPDAMYQNVKTVDTTRIDVSKIGAIWTNEVLAGG